MSLVKSLTLRASAAQTPGSAEDVTGDGVAIGVNSAGALPREAVIILEVDDPAGAAADTLDVLIDAKFGDTWVNIGHFTQVLGNGGAKTFAMAIGTDNPGATAIYDVSSDLAAGATRQIGIGTELRYRGLQTDADASTTFTYGVTAYVK